MAQKRIWIFVIFCLLGLALVGLTTELYLGDEIIHFRFAKDIFRAEKRVTVDSLYGKEFSQQIHYMFSPLWHLLLAYLWKITGGISFAVAQIYHLFYYALLLVSTYFLGKELYGKEEGWHSMVLVATLPMVISFGILFYVDVPLAALTSLTFLFILKKRLLLAGFGFGLMYFIKMNGLIFGIPFLLTILFKNRRNRWWAKLLGFSLAALIVIAPDIYWREKNVLEGAWLGSNQKIVNVFVTEVSENLKGWTDPSAWEKTLALKAPKFGHDSTFLRPKDHIKYFGLPLLLLFILYLMRRAYSKTDLLLWMPILFYFLFFLSFFNMDGDIRYLLPITPFLSILASKSISSWNKKGVKGLIVLLCLIQFLSVLVFVYMHRRIPPEIREAFHYIKEKTPEDAIIIYVDYNLSEYTDRRIYWHWDLKQFFWEKEEAAKKFLIERNIHYLLVKKERIYDDQDFRHLKGYPLSFIHRAPTFDFSEVLLNNGKVSLWKFRIE